MPGRLLARIKKTQNFQFGEFEGRSPSSFAGGGVGGRSPPTRGSWGGGARPGEWGSGGRSPQEEQSKPIKHLEWQPEGDQA